MKLFLPLILLAMISVHASGQTIKGQPQLIPVPLRTAYLPAGFDNNDKVQIVVEGWLPSSCYKSGPFQFSVDRNARRISVRQMAYKYTGTCLDVMSPFHSVVEVGLLSEGNYTVTDLSGGHVLGQIPVRVAASTNPDEVLYASISEAAIAGPAGVAGAIQLQGVFYKSCLKLKEVRVNQENQNVVTVLPVAEVVPNVPCRDAYMPFQTQVALPRIGGGRYLLHVRSMNGQSVNRLFDIR